MSSRTKYAPVALVTLQLTMCLGAVSLGSCTMRPQATRAPAIVTQDRFGSALEAALAAQVTNPQAAEGPLAPTITDGARAVLAADQYRKGTTKPLVRESTSSTKKEGGGS